LFLLGLTLILFSLHLQNLNFFFYIQIDSKQIKTLLIWNFVFC